MNHVENPSCDTGSIVVCTYFGLCLEMDMHITHNVESCILYYDKNEPMLQFAYKNGIISLISIYNTCLDMLI
jgi:hypothetical protein